VSKIISQPQYHLVKALCDRIGLMPTPHVRALALYTDDEQPICLVGYDQWTGSSCTMHVAVDRPALLTRKFIEAAFAFPFVTVGCDVVIGIVPSVNLKALEFDKRLGFVEHCRIKDAYPDGDMVLLSLRKEDCKWLRSRHGKEIKQPAARA
jgi:hypothetical protein